MEEEGRGKEREKEEQKNKQATEKPKTNTSWENEWPLHHGLPAARPKASAPLVAGPASTPGSICLPQRLGTGEGRGAHKTS